MLKIFLPFQRTMSKKDTIEGRVKYFVKKATDFSIEEAKRIIQVSLNKSAAKGVNTTTVDGFASVTTGIPGAKALIKNYQKLAENCSKANEHNQAKRLHKSFFEGLDENDENLQTLRKIFIESYVEFFINRNLQFLHLLQDLEDSWENAMVKLAKDAER